MRDDFQASSLSSEAALVDAAYFDAISTDAGSSDSGPVAAGAPEVVSATPGSPGGAAGQRPAGQRPAGPLELQRDPLVEAELLVDAAIEACVVLGRAGGGAGAQVAYVVLEPRQDSSLLLTRLGQQLAERRIPIVGLLGLPATAEGELDLAALAQIPVREPEVEALWEAHAAAVAGVARAAAVTRPLLRPLPRLHRDCLGGAAVRERVREQAEQNSVSSSAPSVASLTSPAPAVDAPLALRDGAPLPVLAGEPCTL
ncbi:MAG: hypothetical protein RL685_6519, partial [Pseudomonadota bacterium]